jgi:hypothetical protein
MSFLSPTSQKELHWEGQIEQELKNKKNDKSLCKWDKMTEERHPL